MSVQDNKSKIILKETTLPGVDLSVNDRSLLATTPPLQTKVTKPIFKKSRTGFIGLRDSLNTGEVIKVGNLGNLYKIVKVQEISDTEFFIHKIVKVCNSPIRQLDIDATEVGQIAVITSRRGASYRYERQKTQY